jgi:ABC-type polysaccharide/polyol phosphate export permease
MKMYGLIRDIRISRHLWFHLSKMDLASRFRGTYLGVFWLVITQVGTFAITAYIWSKLFSVDFNSFFVYIGLGFAIWGFITNSIVGSASSIFSGISTYLNSNTPLVVAASRVVASNFYILVIGLAVPFSIGIVINHPPMFNLLFFLIGLVLTVVFVTAISIFFSVISIKYKDFPQALSMLFQVLWVVTPIIYKAEMLREKGIAFISEANPFYWSLYVVREPILSNQYPEIKYYVYLLVMTLFLSVACMIFMSNNSRRYLLHG